MTSFIVVVRGVLEEGPFSNGCYEEVETPDSDAGAVHVRALTGERFVIGRSRSCDLPLGDSLLGRRHLHLERHADAWTAVDGGSTNGMSIDGERVARAVLREELVLEFGTTTLRLFAGVGAEARAQEIAESARERAATTPVRRTPAQRAEAALLDAVRVGIERAHSRRHPLAILSVRGGYDTRFLTLCAGMALQNLPFAVVRCSSDVCVVLCADAREAERQAKAVRTVTTTMSAKKGLDLDVTVGIAVLGGGTASTEDYRSDVATALIAQARS